MNNQMTIPRKFLDKESGAVDVEGLVRSYQELERKLSQGQTLTPSEEIRALGIPDTPEEYQIDILEDYLSRDMEMEAVLHRAGFTESQVQLVYDLAAEKLAPLMRQVVQQARGAGDAAKLEAHFGGSERWKKIQRQMRKWGEKNLPPDAYQALCCSHDGVMAIHRMMGQSEPGLIEGGDGGEALSEEQLKRLMKDPRYWRDHDPALTKKVRAGFERLYPGTA